jgi:hypothetical protein
MQIRKEVHKSIVDKLESLKIELDGKIRSNKWKMARMVEDQTVMKRERAELDRLIALVRKG